MLALGETGMALSILNIFSILNIIPVQVDVKMGKIKRQSNPFKVFMWRILFSVGASHWVYMFGRLVQLAVIEPGKYFRWEHFVLHFGMTACYAVFYFTGFCLFVKNEEETVIIFNQLFEDREDPVQKVMGQQEQLQRQRESGPGNRNGKLVKSGTGTRLSSASTRESQNQTQELEIQFKSQSEVAPRPLVTWPPQYSLDEVLAKLHPLIAFFTGFIAMPILGHNPSRPQLLYSSIPRELQNLFSFLILLVVEGLCLSFISFTACFSILTQVLFFSKCQLECKKMRLQLRNLEEKFQNRSLGNGGREIKSEIWILRQISKEMQELVHFIDLFNRCFSFCIFAWKICSLLISVMLYFFVIRHSQTFPGLAGFVGYCAVAVTLVNTVMYEHAFSFTGKMDELKKEFLLTAQKTIKASFNVNGNKNLRAEMKREIKRIRSIWIKVGNFHQMKRESTPMFIDFVIQQVVSLLVLFPR